MKKKYIIPIIDITDYSPGPVMGAEFSIPMEGDEEDEGFDSEEYVGSWGDIWGSLNDE